MSLVISPNILEALQNSQDWRHFVTDVLMLTKNRYDTTQKRRTGTKGGREGGREGGRGRGRERESKREREKHRERERERERERGDE